MSLSARGDVADAAVFLSVLGLTWGISHPVGRPRSGLCSHRETLPCLNFHDLLLQSNQLGNRLKSPLDEHELPDLVNYLG